MSTTMDGSEQLNFYKTLKAATYEGPDDLTSRQRQEHHLHHCGVKEFLLSLGSKTLKDYPCSSTLIVNNEPYMFLMPGVFERPLNVKYMYTTKLSKNARVKVSGEADFLEYIHLNTACHPRHKTTKLVDSIELYITMSLPKMYDPMISTSFPEDDNWRFHTETINTHYIKVMEIYPEVGQEIVYFDTPIWFNKYRGYSVKVNYTDNWPIKPEGSVVGIGYIMEYL